MNAVKRGRAKFLIFCGEPKTLSRSWYHCRHVLSMASKNVSFCSFAMIAIQTRDAGNANLKCIHHLKFYIIKYLV